MKTISLGVCLTFLVFLPVAKGSTVINFDDLSTGNDSTVISNGYQGLQWSNFAVVNGKRQNTNEGYYNGTISVSNVAYNGFGNPAEFSSHGTFNLNSAYVTAAFANGLQVQVVGIANNNVIYNNTYVVSKSGPSFINFNYTNIDKVSFSSAQNVNFVLDDLTITFVNPSASFSASPGSGSVPLLVQFTDHSTGMITGWDWNFGDGSPHNFNQNPSHTFDGTGDFLVTLIVMGNGGITSTNTAIISVKCFPPSFPLTTPGMVQGWGCNYFEQINTGCLTNIAAIAAGRDHSLFLTKDGTVLALGAASSAAAVVPAGLSNVIALAAGDAHSLALKSDGTVIGWGQTSVPSGLGDVVAISAGADHSLALHADGTVVGWGRTTVPRGLSNIVAVSAGRGISLALRDNSTAVGWDMGRGADPSTLSNIVAISAGDNCCYEAAEALQADGTLLIGSAFTNQWFVNRGGVVAISCSRGSDSHVSWGIDSQGDVFAIGGFAFCGGPFLPPGGIFNAVAVASGDAHNLALIGDGPPVTHASLLNPSWDLGGFHVLVPTEHGRVYRLEYKSSLGENSWTSLPLVAGNGSLINLTDPTGSGNQRFYRVRRW